MSLYRPPITVLGATQYEHQEVEVVSVTPTQDTWYTALNTTTNVLLQWIRVYQSNAGGSAKSLRARVTVDGHVFTSSFVSCASATFYYVFCAADGTPQFWGSPVNAAMYLGWPAKSAKVEVQFADTPGTDQYLSLRVQYAKLKATTI